MINHWSLYRSILSGSLPVIAGNRENGNIRDSGQRVDHHDQRHPDEDRPEFEHLQGGGDLQKHQVMVIYSV